MQRRSACARRRRRFTRAKVASSPGRSCQRRTSTEVPSPGAAAAAGARWKLAICRVAGEAAKVLFAVFAAAAALTLAAALAENLWWLIFARAFALRAFNAWSARKRFMKLDQAARAGPLAGGGKHRRHASELAN